MGLMNATAMFMQTMNNLFLDMLDSGVVVFLDDILVYSCIVEEHFTLLENKCKVLLHEKCMPECQTLLICFWLNVCFFHSTLLLHLALH